MTSVAEAARFVLVDVEGFSEWVLQRPLRGYQLEAVRPVLDSVINQRGMEFVWIFARQSGKNESVAQLCAYLLNVFQRKGGQIIHTAPTGDQVATGKNRLQERLANELNDGGWRSLVKPTRTVLGKAAVVWLSGHPQAQVRGATAHLMIIFDEAQDFCQQVAETVFAPMCASTNATRLYIGTTKTANTYLARKKRELELLEAQDGRRRVFVHDWRTVAREVPAYQRFVESEIAKKGADHPAIVTEFGCRELDAAGGLFDARRQALMQGTHPPSFSPRPSALYVATLDVGGQDEGATSVEGGRPSGLANPGRDYTVCWVFEVELGGAAGPVYRAVHCLADQGSPHFGKEEGGRMKDENGDQSSAFSLQPSLADRLLSYLEYWRVAHLVADASGVGLGLTNWLRAQLGEGRVKPFVFSPVHKARLGVRFLALVETGRFRMMNDEWENASDIHHSSFIIHRSSFFRQVAACAYTADPERPLEKGLRWGVPDNATYETVDEMGKVVRRPIHDDYLMAAALVTLVDDAPLGQAESATTPAADPLAEMSF